MTIVEAAAKLRAGEVVAFPTETVYGLGANALDAAAVARIYELKGRPSTSPLIVHVDSIEMAKTLVKEWPPLAQELAERWWPGPLTLVLPKLILKDGPKIPDIVTAGLATVGIRVPKHPIALELIREAGVPLAAPSANKFTGVSPTTAEHVRAAFGEAVPVLDGGPCEVGIESTVVAITSDESGDHLAVLRPGMIDIGPLPDGRGSIRGLVLPKSDIAYADVARDEGTEPLSESARASVERRDRFVLDSKEGAHSDSVVLDSKEGAHSDSVVLDSETEPRPEGSGFVRCDTRPHSIPEGVAHPAPGMHHRHYSPRTPLLLIDHPSQLPGHTGAYVWRTQPGVAARRVQLPADPAGYAARLYATLHQLDDERLPWIAVEAPPDTPEWHAVRDRLHRAQSAPATE